ncbi:amidase [Aurantimonas sp. VKM B-3413]|uniref:amidase n=1 Tax=Aurantimonas sp. VKM B-3413 TaxID=2779401 RepID=UPI001E3FFF93|nr:amidase [Aurantimonas sp. VKM B-3413]MCB8836539.1 amidase [Aurantimonas sp. VKM B-3413]
MYARPVSLAARLADLDSGRIGVEASLRESLERIEAVDGDLAAFVSRAPEESLAAAHSASGPLAGIAFGVKDIFDTADMPTEHGSPIYRGSRPRADAALVAMARTKGACIIGKTATTEFASMDPAATRNPHDPAHTPGGSSSGSAAAVAAGMVPAACGSQTGGSVIRPASFCGVAGYKPSFRLLPTVGMKTFAWSLDTAGLFAASVADVALLAELLTGRPLKVPPLSGAGGISIGLYRSGKDGDLDPQMQAAWDQAAATFEAAGARLVEIEEPAALVAAREAHGTVQGFEAAHALLDERSRHRGAMGPKILATLDAGAAILPAEYDAARRIARIGRKAATALFEEVDALLVPSAVGPAPKGHAFTGDPVMNKLWTLTGNPVVNVPGLLAQGGLPLGVSIVTRFGRDAEALAIGDLLERALARQ